MQRNHPRTHGSETPARLDAIKQRGRGPWARKLTGCLTLALALAAWPASHMVIVSGLGGEPEYESAFVEQAQVVARLAEPVAASVTLLLGEDGGRDAIRDALAEHATGGAQEPIVVVLIGHGSYDGEHYRFNVPGPDPTAEDFAQWLLPLPAKRQLVVLATSASGAAVDVLKGEGRALIAATKDGGEANAVAFGEFWAAALGDSRADIDKDGLIDGDEAFRFAEQAVAAYYEESQRIATEHPRSQGETASFTLAALDGRVAGAAAGGIVARRGELLAEIDALRAGKGELAEEDYFATLQELLLELSAVERELDEP